MPTPIGGGGISDRLPQRYGSGTMMFSGLQRPSAPQETYTQFLQAQLQNAQQQAEHARQMYETVQAGAPPMPGQFIDPMLQKSAQFGMMGGLTPQERAVGKQQLGAQLGAAAGRIHTAGGQRGAYMPGSAAQQVGGRPLQAYARGSAALEAEHQKALRGGRRDVMRTMAGLEQMPWEAGKAAQTAYGETFRRAGEARKAFKKPGTSRSASSLYWWG